MEAYELETTNRPKKPRPKNPDPKSALNNNIRKRAVVEVPNEIKVFVSEPILGEVNVVSWKCWMSLAHLKMKILGRKILECLFLLLLSYCFILGMITEMFCKPLQCAGINLLGLFKVYKILSRIFITNILYITLALE